MPMDPARKRQFKNDVYAVFAGIGQALSNGHRLELLDLLSQAERSVEHLAILASMSVANTSQHLQELGLADPDLDWLSHRVKQLRSA